MLLLLTESIISLQKNTIGANLEGTWVPSDRDSLGGRHPGEVAAHEERAPRVAIRVGGRLVQVGDQSDRVGDLAATNERPRERIRGVGRHRRRVGFEGRHRRRRRQHHGRPQVAVAGAREVEQHQQEGADGHHGGHEAHLQAQSAAADPVGGRRANRLPPVHHQALSPPCRTIISMAPLLSALSKYFRIVLIACDLRIRQFN
jgi:hypothetical protein